MGSLTTQIAALWQHAACVPGPALPVTEARTKVLRKSIP